MEYKSANSGLLSVGMVKDGDLLVIIEDAYSTFSEAKQKTYWNCKVELPDKTHKLAGLMEMVCDEFAKVWGSKTEDWTGHTVRVSIKTSKAGNQYITLVPTDAPKIDLEAIRVAKYKEDVKKAQESGVESAGGNTIEYPKDEINPDDIPF
jgi:hypothetical protein